MQEQITNPDPKTQDADGLNWDNLVQEGIDARQRRDSAQWALGDLAAEVETTYGEHDIERYAEDIGVEYQQLLNYRWLAGVYEISTRVENLGWSHHREVAARKDRLDWLDLAERGKWSVRKMLAEIDEAEKAEAEEAARRKRLAQIAEESADLADSVAAGDVTIDDAFGQIADLVARREREQQELEASDRRRAARLQKFLDGWIEFETFRTSDRRDAVFAILLSTEAEKIIAIEKEIWK